MTIIVLTMFLSFLLATFFAFLYLRASRRGMSSSLEQQALHPLRDDETPRPASSRFPERN